MKATFNPNDYQPSGVISCAAWTNPGLQAAIRQVFDESSRERIVEIVVDEEGIKAVFEQR